MSKRFWKRLAGCLVIECALSAAPGHQAGTAAVEHARAIALEDNRGNRAIFAEADFAVTRAISDFVAAQLAKQHGLDRASLLIYSRGAAQSGEPRALLTAITAALGAMGPAELRFDGVTISIAASDGKCIAALPAGTCTGGIRVRPPIRSAFQMIEGQHGLQIRGEIREAYPVQAVAFGKEAAILGLGGDTRFPATKGIVVIPFANDTSAPPASSVVEAAARRVLARVGR